MGSRPSTSNNIAIESGVNPPRQPDKLADYSPADARWDSNKAGADVIAQIYAQASEFERYAERIADCAGLLRFGWIDDAEGVSHLKLRDAQFCRVRHCSLCQRRRAMMWQARFYQSLPRIVEQYPKARWLFLTLTVRNCEITELRETIQQMNQAWRRLKARKELRPVSGWIRTTEVTRGRDGTAHPHFHVLMMVPSSWFTRHYIKHARWVELWQSCLRVGYAPNVDVRTVRAQGNTSEDSADLLRGTVAEVLKYQTKPDDAAADPEWFREMTRQVHQLRFIATGGALKNVLKQDDETNDDLIHADSEEAESEDDGGRLAFGWQRDDGHYRRVRKADIPPEK